DPPLSPLRRSTLPISCFSALSSPLFVSCSAAPPHLPSFPTRRSSDLYAAELREPFGERLATVPVALDRPLVIKGLAVFGAAVVAWLAGGPLPLVAISAGAVMVAIAPRDPAHAIGRVEWSRLPFFASLFLVSRGLP